VLRVLLVVLVLALYVYALIDLGTSPSDEVRVLPRVVWLLVILVVVIAGPVLWLVFGRPVTDRGGGDGGGGLRARLPRLPLPPGTGGPLERPRKPAPRAPDDDPDFLRGLDERRRSGGDPD